MSAHKVCLLGAIAVGKTSLVRQFVDGVFSERYLTTVGVKIDKKVVDLEDRQVKLIIWDLAGEDQFAQLQPTYLRGAAAYVVIIDPTRPNSFRMGLGIQAKAQATLGSVPHALVLNKTDLRDDWRVTDDELASLQTGDRPAIETSAKTGEGVENLFLDLAKQL